VVPETNVLGVHPKHPRQRQPRSALCRTRAPGATHLVDRSFSRPHGVLFRALKLPRVSAAFGALLVAASDRFAAGGP